MLLGYEEGGPSPAPLCSADPFLTGSACHGRGSQSLPRTGVLAALAHPSWALGVVRGAGVSLWDGVVPLMPRFTLSFPGVTPWASNRDQGLAVKCGLSIHSGSQ